MFFGSSRTLLPGVMLGEGLSSLMWKSHIKLRQNWVEGIHNSPYSHVILSPRPCSHPMAPPCSPLRLPSSGGQSRGLHLLRRQLLLVMLQGGQAGTHVSSGAVEGGCDPEGGSWVPESRAFVLGSHPQALRTCAQWNKRFKLTALAFSSEVPTS